MLVATQRQGAVSSNAMSAHMDTVMRLEGKLAAAGVAQEQALGEAARNAARKLAAALAEKDEVIRALGRDLGAAKEAGEAAVAGEQLRRREALAEAEEAAESAVRALNSRIESLTAAHAAEVAEVGARLTLLASEVDENHAAAARAWAACEGALACELSDTRARAQWRSARRCCATASERSVW